MEQPQAHRTPGADDVLARVDKQEREAQVKADRARKDRIKQALERGVRRQQAEHRRLFE